MSCFVIQVSSGQEMESRRLLEKSGVFKEKSLFFPQRKLLVRRMGRISVKKAPVFPGYLFFQTEAITFEHILVVKKTPKVFRFLKMDGEIQALSPEEERQISPFLGKGEIAGISKVVFEENQKIRILQGPFKDQEGRIVKINLRKQRMKVRLSLYKEAFLVDFGFEIVENAGSSRDSKS